MMKMRTREPFQTRSTSTRYPQTLTVSQVAMGRMIRTHRGSKRKMM